MSCIIRCKSYNYFLYYNYRMPERKYVKGSVVKQNIRARGLNAVEERQVKTIARRVAKTTGEMKYRAWLYPKTVYSEMGHNKPFFLFGPGGQGGMLNLAKGDDSVPTPNGGALPNTAPGNCREGQEIRLRSLTHRLLISGDGPAKSLLVRCILFSYPADTQGAFAENDILLQPTGTGAGQGWPNVFLALNKYNNKGIKFLKDQTFKVNTQTAGAVVEAEVGTNWGLAGIQLNSFNHYFGKTGRLVKYQELNGQDNPNPAIDNIGWMIIPYASNVATENENVGNIQILGNMSFTE